MEEGCHCAFHDMSWMSREMDGRLVGATTALNHVGMDLDLEGMEDPSAAARSDKDG